MRPTRTGGVQPRLESAINPKLTLVMYPTLTGKIVGYRSEGCVRYHRIEHVRYHSPMSVDVNRKTTPTFCSSPAFILSANKNHILSRCLKMSATVYSLLQSAQGQGSRLLASYHRPFSLSSSPNTALRHPLHTALRPIGPDGSGLRALPFLFRMS